MGHRVASIVLAAVLTIGALVPTASAAVPIQNAITGTVTTTAGGAAVSDVCVTAESSGWSETTATNVDGDFVLNLPAGSYTVEYWSCSPLYPNVLPEYHTSGAGDPAIVVADATVLDVTAEATFVANEQLLPGAVLSGTITDTATGTNPIQGVCVHVDAVDWYGDFYTAGDTVTPTDGSYEVGALATGDYEVRFVSCGGEAVDYIGELYDEQSLDTGTPTLYPLVAGSQSVLDEDLVYDGTNQPPTATPASHTVVEDTTAWITVTGSDPEGQALTFQVATPASHGYIGALEGGNWYYTPDPNFVGADSFTFTASDGTSTSAPATISITVTPVNDAPVASSLAVTTPEDTAKVVTMPASDVDDTTLTWAIVANPTHGSLTGANDGNSQVTYTPSAGYVGADSFTFRVNDGELDSNVATVSITVTGSNILPVATSFAVSTPEDTAKAITLQASDADGDPLTYSIVGQPSKGTLSGTADGNSAVTYTPSPNVTGTDTFTFRAHDGTGYSNIATVTITITPVNDAPVATGVSATVPVGQSVEVTLLGSDVDGDTVSYVVASPPSSGTLSAVSGDTVTYTAPATPGTVTFTYRASDGTLQSSAATVTITVTDSSADTTSATGTVGAGETLKTDGDRATDGNPVVTAVTTPTGGEVSISEGERQTGPPSGYRFFQQEVTVAAPAGTVEAPLVIEFRIHESLIPGHVKQFRLFRNGRIIDRYCTPHDVTGDGVPDPYADPDPCQAAFAKVGEEFHVTVWTSQASAWNFGVEEFTGVERLAGDTRILTAVEISRSEFAAGAGTVVLARADAYPDALAGAPLAASLGAPILLTDSAALPNDVANEIQRLGAARAVLLGGEAALHPTIVEGLAGLGIAAGDVTRLAGTTRFDTARLIAEELGGTAVYVTEGSNANPGRGWPDAVAVSGLAAFQRRPILLVTSDGVPSETAAALGQLGVTDITIVGGPVAVSAATETTLARQADVQRIAGSTRYETSRAVADASVLAGMDPTRTWLATGRNFPDALAAGPAVARDGGVLLLTLGEELGDTPSTLSWVETYGPSMVRTVLAGGEVVLTETFATQLAGALPS